jgi:hypothetical protein
VRGDKVESHLAFLVATGDDVYLNHKAEPHALVPCYFAGVLAANKEPSWQPLGPCYTQMHPEQCKCRAYLYQPELMEAQIKVMRFA